MDLSPSEQQYFKRMFDLYDTDKSGAIGLSELRNLSKHLGVELSEDEVIASVRSIGITAEPDDIDLAFPHFVSWLHNAQASDEFAVLKAKIKAKGSKVLNNDQIARLKEVFDHFDADGSGAIDAGELLNVFHSMDQKETTLEDMEQMIASVDDDGNGTIEFGEFMVLMCSNFGSKSFEEDMQEEFGKIDPDTSGKISIDALKEMIRKTTGGLIKDDEIDMIIESIDEGKNGNHVEYIKWRALWEACSEDD